MYLESSSPRISVATISISIAIWVASSFEVSAQIGRMQIRGMRGFESGSAGQFIEPDRTMRQQITKASEAIQEKRFSDAIILLGELLTRKAEPGIREMRGQDFFLDTDNPKGASDSLMQAAERILGSLPPKGLETYQLKYGSVADSEFKQAWDQHDWDLMSKVSREYLFTDAGQQATRMLAYRELLNGQPLAAAMILDRLHRHQYLRQQGGNAMIALLAGCWYQAARPDAAVEVMLGTIDDGKRQVVLDGKTIDLPAVGEDKSSVLAWLTQNFPALDPLPGDHPIDQAIPGGTLAHTGYRGSELPVQNERWMQRTTGSRSEQETVESIEATLRASGEFPLPTIQPIVVGNTVLTKNTQRLLAFDFNTGKLIWPFPWADEELEGSPLEPDDIANEQTRNLLLQQRIWSDHPYGRITSDQQRVFMLTGLDEVRPALSPQVRVFGGQATSRSSGETNTLVALDIQTEGKLLWQIDGAEAQDPELADTFFLGPPLPIQGRLYVMGEQRADIFLICLDPASGRLLWRQQLLAVETQSITGSQLRRLSGAIPAYADGVLVCPTVQGTLVAVDIEQRALRWGFRYDSIDYRGYGQDQNSFPTGWHDGTPIISEGTVLLTAPDSNALHAIDLQTGKPIWPAVPKQDWKMLAGVDQGVAVLFSNDSLRGISVKSGRRVWDCEDPLKYKESIIGSGAFGNGKYFFPVSGNRLKALDLQNGRVVASQRARYPLGNLVSVRGQLLSQSSTHLAIAHGMESAQQRVTEALALDPNATWALILKGELLMEDDKFEEAIDLFRSVLSKQPDSETARVFLVQALFQHARSQTVLNDRLMDDLKRYAEKPDEKSAVMRLTVLDQLNANKLVAAADTLLNMSAPLPQHDTSLHELNMNEKFELLDGRTTTLDSWISGRVNDLLSKADADQLAQINRLVDLRLDSGESLVSPIAQLLQRQFGALPACDRVLFALANRYREESEYLKAERLLLDSIGQMKDQQRRNRFQLMLAGLYLQVAWQDDAMETYRLAGEPKEIDTDNEWLNQQSLRLASMLKERTESTKTKPQWPPYTHLQPPTSPTDQLVQINVLEMMQNQGLKYAGWNISVSRSKDALLFISPTGAEGFQYKLESGGHTARGPNQVLIDHGMMIVIQPTMIIGLNLFSLQDNPSEMEVWRLSLETNSVNGYHANTRSAQPNPFGQLQEEYIAQNKGGPVVRTSNIVGSQLNVLTGRSLKAIDTTSGDVRWQATVDVSDGEVVAGADVVCVLSEQTHRVLRFNAHDGTPLPAADWMQGLQQVWAAAGKNALIFEQDQPGRADSMPLTLRLIDSQNGKLLLEEKAMTPGVKGQVVDNRYVAFCQADGELTIWDLLAGKVLTQSKLPLGNFALHNIRVMLHQDRIVVFSETNRPSPNGVRYTNSDVASRHLEIGGPAMAYDLKTGKPLWDQPADIESIGLSTDQATAGPLVFLLRREKPTGSPNGVLDPTLTLLALDVRTGKVVARAEGDRARTVPTMVFVRSEFMPQTNEYLVRADRYHYVFTLTDKKPPEPAKQTKSKDPGTTSDNRKVERQREAFGFFEPQP